MIFSYIHSAYSHAGHPIQTKIMMTQTKYDDRYLILHVSCITLVTLVTLIRQVTLATVVTLVILVTMVTLFWSSIGPRVSPFRFFLCLRKLAVLVQWRVASTYYSLQITALPTTSSSNHYLKMRLGFSSNPSSIIGWPCHLLLTH